MTALENANAGLGTEIVDLTSRAELERAALQQELQKERAIQSYRRRPLLDLGLLFNPLLPTLSHSALIKRYRKNVGMMLSLCVVELRHKKSCSLLRIVNRLSNWLMLGMMFPLFIGRCQNIVPSFLLILSQDSMIFVVVFSAPLARMQSRQREIK